MKQLLSAGLLASMLLFSGCPPVVNAGIPDLEVEAFNLVNAERINNDPSLPAALITGKMPMPPRAPTSEPAWHAQIHLGMP